MGEHSVSDYYYDDPVEESSPKRFKLNGFVGLVLFLFAGGTFLQTTLAANINLNSGGGVEFGQGRAVTVGCAGATNLTMTPRSSFVNQASGGQYYLTSVTVTGIPNTCFGEDFSISAFDDTAGTGALPIFNSNRTIATIYNNAGTFEQGFQGTGTTVSSSSGEFTVTFTAPVALASDVKKLTLQSTEHVDWNCRAGGPCTVGETGPGGGIIFFVGGSFNCGPTGSSTCNTLEVAPANWNGAQSESGPWAAANRAYTDMNGFGGMVNDNSPSLSNFGRGYINTLNIMNRDAGLTIAARRAQEYRGGNLSDWYLPNIPEINALCRWVKVQAPNPGAGCSDGGQNAARSALVSIGGQHWSSSESNSGEGSSFHLSNESFNERQNKTISYKIRPIRAF